MIGDTSPYYSSSATGHDEVRTPESDEVSFILPSTAFKTEDDARKINALIEEVSE